jgi:DNA recombination protein RmuC
VKTEFEKFGGVIAETEKKLQEAANKFQSVGVRTRAIQRKLQDVQALPVADSAAELLDSSSDETQA